MPLTQRLHDHVFPILDGVHARHPAEHLVVAVSGGADSMALLLLAKAWCDARRRRVTALTVDHQFRPESAAEAQQVNRWCTARKIPHHGLRPPSPPDIHNLQSRAREMRYRALTDWCASHDAPLLLVAHHADDQAETVALQQHRGDTPPSRSGMALVSARDDVQLVRPLLGVRKTTLIAYLHAHGQEWLEDPTNQSDAYARNRLRTTLDDETIQILWLQAQAQGKLRQEEDEARNEWIAAYVTDEYESLLIDAKMWRALPAMTRTDLLSRAIQAVGGKKFRPRLHESNRLDQQIHAAPRGKTTLGYCIISWKPGAPMRIAPELPPPLAHGTRSTHILPAEPLKQLASPPFWWFTYPPFPIG